MEALHAFPVLGPVRSKAHVIWLSQQHGLISISAEAAQGPGGRAC